MEFEFPKNMEKYRVFKSTADIKAALSEQLESYKGFYYILRKTYNAERNVWRFVAECNKCTAKLCYSNHKGVYTLKSNSNKHSHKFKRVGQDINPFQISNTIRRNSLFISKEMSKDYQKFSKCLYITLCPLKDIKMLFFSGLSQKQHIHIFGMCLFSLITKNRIKYIFQQFLKEKSTLPETIVINVCEFNQILCEMFKGTIIYSVGEIVGKTQIKTYVQQVSKATSQEEYQIKLNKIINISRDNLDLQKLIKFIHSFKNQCLGFLPSTFVGLGLSVQHKSFLQYEFQETFLKEGIRNLQKLFCSFPRKIKTGFDNEKTNQKFQKLSESQHLLTKVYKQIPEAVLVFLLGEYNKIMKLTIEQNYKNEKIFSVRKINLFEKMNLDEFLITIDGQKIQCSCGLRTKTGLPCCHIMKYCSQNNLEIRSFINPYWFQKDEIKQSEFFKHTEQQIQLDKDKEKSDILFGVTKEIGQDGETRNLYMNRLRQRAK